ncbi:MAG: HEPN domain-containing protein [bacterium]
MSVKEAKSEFIRAEKSLKSADVLFHNGFYEDAISRAYYAILHSAKASLTLMDINVESHRGVRRLFGQHLIKTGKIADKYARILSAEQDERLKADYDALYFADE